MIEQLRFSMSVVLYLAILVGIVPAGAQPIGPSFECNQSNIARDIIAAVICASPELARVDLAYVQSYQALRQMLPEKDRNALRKESVAFNQATLQECGLQRLTIPNPPTITVAIPCVTAAYGRQRSMFLSRLS